MRLQVATTALVVTGALFGISVATAQTSSPPPQSSRPPAFKNLQVFPKDVTRPQLIANMRFFAQSLGVRCTFCHVGVEGQPPSTYDFASDAKKEKAIARKMLLMVHRINEQDFAVADANSAKVTCFTCHRGSQRPLTMPPAESPASSSLQPPVPNSALPPPKPKAERG